MNEECKDCIQVANIEDKIKALWHQIEESKEQRKDFEKRITELEITRGETKEQLNSIKDFLERIEKSIEALTAEIANIKNQPTKNLEKFKWIFITALTSAGVGTIIGFMIKK